MAVKLGDLEMLELVATGSMLEVYRARLGERNLAVKKILPELTREKELLQLFLDEARVAASLRHANIVAMHDLARSEEGEYFIVMDFADGKDLAEVVEASPGKAGRFTPGAALHVARETLRALEYAHAVKDRSGRLLNLVHRDVSPHNVLLGFDGWVKLTDFGTGKVAHSGHAAVSNVAKSRAGYLSPEHARGKKPDARSDLYGVGILLYEMLTGERLPPADVPRLPAPLQIPAELEQALRKALAKNPEERFSDAGQMIVVLDAAAQRLSNFNGARDVSVMVRRLFGQGVLEANKVPERTRMVSIQSAMASAPPAPAATSPRPTSPTAPTAAMPRPTGTAVPAATSPRPTAPDGVIMAGKGVMALDKGNRPVPSLTRMPAVTAAHEDNNATQMVDIAELERRELAGAAPQKQTQQAKDDDAWAPTPSKETRRPTGVVPAARRPSNPSNPSLATRPPVVEEDTDDGPFQASAPAAPSKRPPVPADRDDDTVDHTHMDLAPPGLVLSKKPPPKEEAPPAVPALARKPTSVNVAVGPRPSLTKIPAVKSPPSPPARKSTLGSMPPPPPMDLETDELAFRKPGEPPPPPTDDAFRSVSDAPAMVQPAAGGHTMMMMADALRAADGLLGPASPASGSNLPVLTPVDSDEAEKERKKQEALERLRAKKAAKTGGSAEPVEGSALLFDAADDVLPVSPLSDAEKERKKQEALERIRAKKAAKAAAAGDDGDIAPPPDVGDAPEVAAREEAVDEWRTTPDAPPSAPHPERAGKVLVREVETYDRDVRPMARRGAWRIGEPAISPGSLPRRARRQFFRTAFSPAIQRRGLFLLIAGAVGGYFLSLNYGVDVAREVVPYLGKEASIFFPGAVLVNAAGSVAGTTVTVRTSPPGATVALDGEELPGVTPLTVQRELKAGVHAVVVKKDGTQKESSITLTEGQPGAHVHLNLADAGAVEITGVLMGSEVLLDGRVVGQVPMTLSDVGRDRIRHLQVRVGELVVVDQPLLPNRVAPLVVDLGKTGGAAVMVHSTPAAWVSSDGVALNQTTGPSPLMLSAGKHTLTLVSPSSGQSRTLLVEAGKTARTYLVDFHD